MIFGTRALGVWVSLGQAARLGCGVRRQNLLGSSGIGRSQCVVLSSGRWGCRKEPQENRREECGACPVRPGFPGAVAGLGRSAPPERGGRARPSSRLAGLSDILVMLVYFRSAVPGCFEYHKFLMSTFEELEKIVYFQNA